MRINFLLSPESTLLLAQACRQLNLSPEALLEELIVQLLRAPKSTSSLSALIGHRLRTIERAHRVLRETEALQERLQTLCTTASS
jgi:hypothetical protein